MKIVDADFVLSAAEAGQVPVDGLAHVVLVGRSNVGKSTLINALTRARIARTSATPGKTRLLNLYRVSLGMGRRLDFVDLPGYGYARGVEAREFDPLISGYWAARQQSPQGTLCLFSVDARHPGLAADAAAWTWLRDQGVHAVVVATKVDKLSRAERVRHLREFDDVFHAPVVAVSAARHEGIEELWQQIIRHLPQ